MSELLAYNAVQMAKALGVSEWTVRRMAKEGRLPSIRLGKRLLFPRAEVTRWLNEQAR